MAQGWTRCFKIVDPCNTSLSSTIIYSAPASWAKFNLNTILDLPQAEFCILYPFSDFLSIAIYMGRHVLIQRSPIPYHRYIDSSMHITSAGVTIASRWSLNIFTNPSTNDQRNLPEDIPAGLFLVGHSTVDKTIHHQNGHEAFQFSQNRDQVCTCLVGMFFTRIHGCQTKPLWPESWSWKASVVCHFSLHVFPFWVKYFLSGSTFQ